MHHVLLTGADSSLLYTRALVLEKTGASIKSAAPAQALLLLDNCAFDLLVICHSTSERDMHQLCLAARTHTPAIKILLIESPTGNYHAPVQIDHRFLLESGPESLLRTVKYLLTSTVPSELTPAANPAPFVRDKRHGSSYKSLQTLAQGQPTPLRVSAANEAKT